MNLPENIKYVRSHEWVEELPNGNVRIGITDYAQNELGDLVFVNLPEEGDEAVMGETIADVESVKAVSDIYSPVSGKVVAINDALLDTPEMINSGCYEAWLVEIADVADTEKLMDAKEYAEFLAEEG